MAPLFSKVYLNKLWHDVQNEETLSCAKFGNPPFFEAPFGGTSQFGFRKLESWGYQMVKKP